MLFAKVFFDTFVLQSRSIEQLLLLLSLILCFVVGEIVYSSDTVIVHVVPLSGVRISSAVKSGGGHCYASVPSGHGGGTGRAQLGQCHA